MDSDIEVWKTQLITLSERERVELAHFLLSSLDDPEAGDVVLAWDAEASRRVEEIRAGDARGRPIDDFLADLRERYP